MLTLTRKAIVMKKLQAVLAAIFLKGFWMRLRRPRRKQLRTPFINGQK
jgi:hypothetical protein